MFSKIIRSRSGPKRAKSCNQEGDTTTMDIKGIPRFYHYPVAVSFFSWDDLLVHIVNNIVIVYTI